MRRIVLAAVLVSLMAGCTPGQLAPADIKQAVYAARADAIVTSEQSAGTVTTQPTSMPALQAALQADQAALQRITSLLDGPRHWFEGTATQPASGGAK